MSDLLIANTAFAKLISDSTFLGYFGLTLESSMGLKAKKIQKEMEPNGLTSENIPLCCIYPTPGLKAKVNDLVYDAMFEVAIYSNSSTGVYPKAGTMRIGERARELLHQVQLGGATFLTEFQASFSSPAYVPGIKKYVMRFKVSEVIG